MAKRRPKGKWLAGPSALARPAKPCIFRNLTTGRKGRRAFAQMVDGNGTAMASSKTNELTTERPAPGDDAPERPIQVPDGGAASRDPGAAQFLETSGLPVSALLLGLFDQSDDCIKLIDPEGRLQFMNCNGKQAMEIDDFAAVAGRSWDSLWPVDSQEMVRQAIAQAKAGRPMRFEAFCPTAKGTPRWWEVTVSPIPADDGSVAAILSSSRDITDRKLKEDALAAVAAEMKHRLRNAYTVGAAVGLAMAKDSPQHRDFANRLATKLVALADVQASLVDANDVALDELVRMTINAFGASEQAIALGPMPSIRLEEQRAKALVLVLGELATNSLKYGALSGRGRVAVDASVTDGAMVIEWREEHFGPEDPSTFRSGPGGSGQQLMARMLATIGGTISSGASDTGYCTTVTIAV